MNQVNLCYTHGSCGLTGTGGCSATNWACSGLTPSLNHRYCYVWTNLQLMYTFRSSEKCFQSTGKSMPCTCRCQSQSRTTTTIAIWSAAVQTTSHLVHPRQIRGRTVRAGASRGPTGATTAARCPGGASATTPPTHSITLWSLSHTIS